MRDILFGIGINWDEAIRNNVAGCTPKQRMARKIYYLLSLRNKEGTNVYHLNLEFVGMKMKVTAP